MNLDKKSLPAYLRRKKLLGPGQSLKVVECLSSGPKNLVYYVATAEDRWIVKQALSRVQQVKERWWIDRKRIFHEKSCLEVLAQILPPDILPTVVLEDRTDFVLVTNPPPRDALSWDVELRGGRIDLQLAVQCGELLAEVHNETFDVRELKSLFRDTKPFEQLRLEPLYTGLIQTYPDLKKLLEHQTRQLLKSHFALVLGDIRPRNVWIASGQIFLVDFAMAHFGNPSFDLAFFASDMCLKAMQNSPQKAAYLEAINIFWSSYFRIAEYPKKADVEKSAVRDFGCLLLGAIDGRLPVDFMDEPTRQLARRIAHNLLFTELERIEDITEFINRTLIDG